MLVAISTGVPLTFTRAAGTVHWILTHGCGLVPVPIGTWNGQPATGNVSVEEQHGHPADQHAGVGGDR